MTSQSDLPPHATDLSRDASNAMTSPNYQFTVFTPTRNRAHTLHRVYNSLCAQTFRDFEWLIIDNGSTDGTTALVESWQRVADFPIRYLFQENAGLHVSWSRGVAEASGRFLLGIRSADSFTPDALERFDDIWRTIPEDERAGFSGASVNCVDENGQLIGTEFPKAVLDSDSSEIRHRYKVRGEKWGFHRVDVMRSFSLPVVEGYLGYVPESILWREIGRHYKTRYVNERLRTYWQDQKRESRMSVSAFRTRAMGGLLEAQSILNEDLRWFRYDPLDFLRRSAKYSRASFDVGRSLGAQFRGLRNWGGRLLWAVTLPVGWLLHLFDRAGGG